MQQPTNHRFLSVTWGFVTPKSSLAERQYQVLSCLLVEPHVGDAALSVIVRYLD